MLLPECMCNMLFATLREPRFYGVGVLIIQTVFNNDTRPSNVISPDVKYLPTYFKQFGYNMERYGKIMHSSFEIIRHFDIDVHILILTVFDTNEKVFKALCAGASGYLLKKLFPLKLLTRSLMYSTVVHPCQQKLQEKC